MAHEFSLIPSGCVAVTPSDSTVLNLRGFYVGVTGTVVVGDGLGNNVTFTACPAGLIVPVQCKRIMVASTATSIVGFVA